MSGPIRVSGHARESRFERAVLPWFWRAASAALLAIGCGSCASAPSYPYAHGVDGDGNPAPQHFFVLPLNIVVPVPEGLDGTRDDVFSAVASYLRQRGNSIETIGPEDALARWHQSVGEVAASPTLPHDFETAVKVFVERTHESNPFDAMILPALVYRETELRERKVKWDRVVRKYKIINVSEEAKKKKLPGQLTPVFSGVSLHVMVFTPNGEEIFQGYGGLDLAHDLDLQGAERTLRAQLSLRTDLLKNSRHLREGIAHAFDPYLPED